MEAHNVIEKVPSYTCTYSDDGKKETITLTVSLPGCESADDIEVELEARLITVRVPGAYKLSVQLKSPVDPTDEVNLKPPAFDRHKCVLKLKLLALPSSPDDQGAYGGPTPSIVAPSRPPIHESFFEDLPSQGKRSAKGKSGKTSGKRRKEEEEEEEVAPAVKQTPPQAPLSPPSPPPAPAPTPVKKEEPEIKVDPSADPKEQGINEQGIFDLAKAQMNKEAAAEVARRAELVLTREGKGEAARALKLMQKAASLDPEGPYASILTEERWRAAAMGSSASASSSSQPRGGPVPVSEGSEGKAHGSEGKAQASEASREPPQAQGQRKGRGASRKEEPVKPQNSKHAKQPEQKTASPPPPPPPPPPSPPPPPDEEEEFEEQRRWMRDVAIMAESFLSSLESFLAVRINASFAGHVKACLNVILNLAVTFFSYVSLIVPFLLHYSTFFLPLKFRRMTFSLVEKMLMADSPLLCLAFFVPGAYITYYALVLAYNIAYWPLVLLWWTLAFLFRSFVIFPVVSLLWKPSLFFSIPVAALPTIVFSLSGDSRLRDPIYDNLCFIPLTSYFSGSGITTPLSIFLFLFLSTVDSHHRLSQDWKVSSLPNELMSYWRFTRSPFKSFLFTILMCTVGSVRKMPGWTGFRPDSAVDPNVAYVGVFLVFGFWLMLVGATEAEAERERVQKDWEERRQRQRQRKEDNQHKSSHHNTFDPSTFRLVDESKAHPGASGEVLRVLKCHDHYDILGLSREEVEAAQRAGTLVDVIKKAMRVKSLSVHPDKVGVDAVGAKEAFQRVNEAASILSDAQKRALFYECQHEDDKNRHASSSSSSSFSQPPSVGDELPFSCPKCGGEHVCSVVSMKSDGRYCKEHDCFHALDNGVLWVDKRSIFSFRRYLLCYEGVVLDVTELVACGKMSQTVAWYEANACRPMHMAPEKKSDAPNKFRGKVKKGRRT